MAELSRVNQNATEVRRGGTMRWPDVSQLHKKVKGSQQIANTPRIKTENRNIEFRSMRNTTQQ